MAKSVNKPHWALLGGTFDPIHIGHLRIAVQLRDFGFTKVLLIPNHVPPHRPQPLASAEHRLAMLELSCANLDGIEPCTIELTRPELSYSAVTVAALCQQYPEVSFSWVMGEDAWQGFEHWHQPLALLDHANLVVISRPGNRHTSHWQEQQLTQRNVTAEQLWIHAAGKICLQHWPELDISASNLRQAIRQGDNVAFLTPDAVLTYIQQHKLYQ